MSHTQFLRRQQSRIAPMSARDSLKMLGPKPEIPKVDLTKKENTDNNITLRVEPESLRINSGRISMRQSDKIHVNEAYKTS